MFLTAHLKNIFSTDFAHCTPFFKFSHIFSKKNMVFLFLVSRVKMNFQRFDVTTTITNSSGMYTILSNKRHSVQHNNNTKMFTTEGGALRAGEVEGYRKREGLPFRCLSLLFFSIFPFSKSYFLRFCKKADPYTLPKTFGTAHPRGYLFIGFQLFANEKNAQSLQVVRLNPFNAYFIATPII